MLPLKIITGGQTGADLGALEAAEEAGVPTGGYAAKEWLVEDLGWSGAGPRPNVSAPWLADYGLVECPEEGYAARRKMNVGMADAVVLFGDLTTPGSRGLLADLKGTNKPFLHVDKGRRPSEVAALIRRWKPQVVMVAGNRESSCPGIQERVKRFMADVFRQLEETTAEAK